MSSIEDIRCSNWKSILPTVYGWGIVDTKQPVISINKLSCKRERCLYYDKWVNMIRRARCKDYKLRNPTYSEVQVCEDWKYLSNFILWVDSQPNKDWIDCEMDKDLLYTGNTLYSPITVVFLNKKVNVFLTTNSNTRGDLMIGVSSFVSSKNNPYVAYCKNPFSKKKDYIGIFPTELEAHRAWQAKKHEHACCLAELQDDPRVVKALRERYAPDKDWTKV